MPKKQKFRSDHNTQAKKFFSDIAYDRGVNIVKNMPQADIRYLAETDPQALTDRLNADAPIYELGLDERYLQMFLREVVPGHIRPDPATRQERLLRQERLSARIHEIYTKHNIITGAYHDPETQLDRQITSAFVFTDFSPEGLEETRDFFRTFERGTSAEKAEALLRQLQKVAEIDLTLLDPAKTETYENHLTEALQVALVGAECQRFVAFFLKEAPEKLDDPRLQGYLKKANAMYELGGLLKPCMDMLCSDLYPELGFWENPAIGNIDFEAPAIAHPEDTADDVAWGDERELETTVQEKYLDFDGFVLKDGSAYSYLKQVSWLKQLASPLMSAERSFSERLDSFIQADDHFQIKKYWRAAPAAEQPAAQAEEPKLLPKIGLLPLEDPETLRLLDRYLYQNGNNIPEFHPGLPGDLNRLYVKNAAGVLEPACFQGQTRLTESQTRDILTTDGKYFCFPAGSSKLMVFAGGELRDAEQPEIPKPGTKAAARMQGMADSLLQRETQVRSLEREAFSLNRVERMQATAFGPSLADRGSEAGRNYQQTLTNYLAERPGTEYPDVSSRLTENEVTALTMLSIARPDVNGRKYPIGKAEGNTLSGFSMLVNDLYIQRVHSNTAIFPEWAVSGRQALAPALERFSKNGDPAELAETVVKGLGVLNMACKNRSKLEGSSLSELFPALRVTELLEQHPELLQAAQDYADRQGGEVRRQFEKDRAECSANARLARTMRDGLEAERRLLETEVRTVERDGGWVEVRKEAPAEATVELSRLCSFLKAEYVRHVDALSTSIGDRVSALAMEMVEKSQAAPAQDREKVENAYQALMEMELLDKPMSPAVQLAFQHDGLDVLKAVVAGSGSPLDAEKICGMLEDYGLIPREGEAAGFDYDARIRDFRANHMADFLPSPEKREAYQKIAAEYGLDYDDLRDLAANQGISVAEYLKRVAAENHRETQSELDRVKERLQDDRLRELSPEDMCSTLKELNSISASSREDLNTLAQCETLLTRLYLHMVAYEKLNPEFTQQKDRLLKRQDYLDARETVRRGVVAVQKLTGRFRAQEAAELPELELPHRQAPHRSGPGLG